jgi:predicted PurR-regulated permease PerM
VATGLSSPVAALLRLISRLACLIVIASFAIFVAHQATNASNNQQNEVTSSGAPSTASVTLPTTSNNHKSAAHKLIDEASEQVTSPFSAITSGINSQWGLQLADLVLTLLLYGFALSFLARALRN